MCRRLAVVVIVAVALAACGTAPTPPKPGAGAINSLRAAVQQAEQARLLGERTVFLAQHTPYELRWHAQLYTHNTMDMEELQRLLVSIAKLTATADVAVREVARLPAQLSQERADALNDLLSRFEHERIATLRDTFAGVERERRGTLEHMASIIQKERAAIFAEAQEALTEQRKAIFEELAVAGAVPKHGAGSGAACCW